jgi:hypothetical protein
MTIDDEGPRQHGVTHGPSSVTVLSSLCSSFSKHLERAGTAQTQHNTTTQHKPCHVRHSRLSAPLHLCLASNHDPSTHPRPPPLLYLGTPSLPLLQPAINSGIHSLAVPRRRLAVQRSPCKFSLSLGQPSTTADPSQPTNQPTNRPTDQPEKSSP